MHGKSRILRKIILEDIVNFFCKDSCTLTCFVFLHSILERRIIDTIHRKQLIGSQHMRQNGDACRENFDITNHRVCDTKIRIVFQFICDDIKALISSYCIMDDLIHRHGMIIPIQCISISHLRIFIVHNSASHIDEYFLQSSNDCNTKFEIFCGMTISTFGDNSIVLSSQIHLVICNSSNGSQVHTLDIAILVCRTTRQNGIIHRVFQATLFSFRSTTNIDSSHMTREANITQICMHHILIQHGDDLICL